MFSSFRWRFRLAAIFRIRFLHLSDSQVAIAALCHGRPLSRAFAGMLMRCQAYLLASGSFAFRGSFHFPSLFY